MMKVVLPSGYCLSVTESLPSTYEYSKQDGTKVARHSIASLKCVVFPRTHQWHLCTTLSKCIKGYF